MPKSALHENEAQITYSAITFRKLLHSLARPGKIHQLTTPAFLGSPPLFQGDNSIEPLSLNLYALGALATLLDGETSFALAAHGKWLTSHHPLLTWLAVHTGSHEASPEVADFSMFCDGTSDGLLLQLSQGSLLEPETSTTAFYCVERLVEPGKVIGDIDPFNSGEIVLLELTGPGISGERALTVYGLSHTEVELIQTTRANYPRGIDLYLIDTQGRCVGLPRTTKIRLVALVRG